MSASAAFRRSIFLARSARTSFNVSRTGVRSFNPENSALRLHRVQQNGSTTRLNSDQTRAFLNENHNASNEVPLDLEGSVRKISGKLLRQSADAAKDLGVKCTVTSLVRPDSSLDIAADWVIKDKGGDVIMFWRDVAHGALTKHASAEKLESKEGRRGISLVAVKLGMLMEKFGVKLGVIHDGNEMLAVRVTSGPYQGSYPSIEFIAPIPMDAKIEGRPICQGFVRHLMFIGRKGVDTLLEDVDEY